MQTRKIILASKSPRRRRLLEQMGVNFQIQESKYEEEQNAKSDPIELVKYLALKKAEEVATYFDDAIIIGADSIVLHNNKIIGKPKDRQEAFTWLKQFGEKEHKAITGLAVIDTKTKKAISDFNYAQVKFRKLTAEEIEAYLDAEKFLDLAGGYSLQDRAAVLIEKIEGDFFSVVGLPMSKLYLALKELGVDMLKK